jgi:hypothetical protein
MALFDCISFHYPVNCIFFFFFFYLCLFSFVPKAYGRDTNCQLVNACVVILFCIVLLETLAWIDWYPADVGKCHQSMRGTPGAVILLMT